MSKECSCGKDRCKICGSNKRQNQRSPVERGVMRDVIKVDHGNVFNTGSWYTFYCPQCKRQIGRDNSEYKCHWCNCAVKW